MLRDWVSSHLKPLKNQTKCQLNLNFLAVFESRAMRSLVITMKKVDIPSCVAVSRYPSYANHYLKSMPIVTEKFLLSARFFMPFLQRLYRVFGEFVVFFFKCSAVPEKKAWNSRIKLTKCFWGDPSLCTAAPPLKKKSERSVCDLPLIIVFMNNFA